MNKVIVITGTSSGFGTLMVKTFSKAGHTVIATMRGTKTKNEAIAKELAELPGVDALELDVTDDHSVKTAVEYIIERYKKIDVVVNNAGVHGNGFLEGYSVAQFQKTMDINVYGILRVYHEVLPAMRARKEGLIINISSSAGHFALPLQAPYNVSKHAVEALTEGTYAELAAQGIENVLLAPGPFLTELFSKEGINGDREGIEDAYGDFFQRTMQQTGEKFGVVLNAQKPNPQLVADAALALIDMAKGTRPLRTAVDPIAQGIELEFDQITTDLKKRWIGSYGL